MKTIRTLFSGGELFGLGAQAAGYRHIDGTEIRADIATIANRNGFRVLVADVCDVNYEVLPPVDHLHASPSCKSASQANPNGGETADDLAIAGGICRAIRAHTGDTFSLENVWPYRHYESFKRIKAALKGAGFDIDVQHINSADYGVPQTRKRLILRAVRGRRVPLLTPTHRRGGDMFSPPWVGWYAAIEDLIDSLPPTEPAPWQEQRLKRLLDRSLLVHPTDMRTMPTRETSEPAFTITAGSFQESRVSGHRPRAFLIGNGNTNLANPTNVPREADEPAFTVHTNSNRSFERALLLSGAMSQGDEIVTRWDDEPSVTVVAADRVPQRALLIDGANGRPSDGHPTVARGDAPAFTIGANKVVHRAVLTGRWVRLTVQALGRFQTVPDSYIGLTSEINGNGVPVLLAQRIMESFL